MQTHSQSKFTSRSVLCHKFAYTTSTTRARLQLRLSSIWTIYLYSSTAHLTLTAPSVHLVCTYSTRISCSTAVTVGLLLPQWKFLALKVYSRDFQQVATTFWFVYLPIGALNSLWKNTYSHSINIFWVNKWDSHNFLPASKQQRQNQAAMLGYFWSTSSTCQCSYRELGKESAYIHRLLQG